MIQKRQLSWTAALISLAMSGHAYAHYLWLERADGEAQLFFGEAEMQMKERSPGRLDEFQAPRAFAQPKDGVTRAVPVIRAENSLRLPNIAGTDSVYIVDETIPVKDLTRYGLGFAKSNYYSRVGALVPVQKEALPLDIRAEENNTYTILYMGKPIQGAKVDVIAANTWMQEHKSDSKGRITVNTPWKGQYIVHVLHVDKAAGTFEGKSYDSLRNHLTYTFTTKRGAPPGPAQAPKHEE